MPQHILRPGEGAFVDLGGFGVLHRIGRDRSGGGFSLVEHPIAPRALAAPMHTHRHEDEYTHVLEGEIGLRIGDDELIARSGDLVVKPRGVPHAFWNPGDTPARVLEIISPGGFESYFEEIAEHLPPNRPEPDEAAIGAVMARYGLEMDPASIPELIERHGLRPDARMPA